MECDSKLIYKMEKFKYILLILIYLAAQNFFNPLGLVPLQLSKALFYVFCIVGLFITRKNYIVHHLHYPIMAYKCVIAGIVISIFSVWMIYDQPLMISVMTTLPYLFGYLYFYIMLSFNIDKQKLIKLIEFLVVCSFLMYVVNILTVPNVIFGAQAEEYDDSRGVIRLTVPMIELVVMYLFYSINQWVETAKRRWILFIIIAGFLVIMSVIRQIILLSFIFSFLLIMQRVKWWKKIVALMCISFFVSCILPEIPIYKKMMEVSEQQISSNKYEEEDIRVRAWRFYTIEYQKNFFTQIFGNGLPSKGNSKRGDEMEKKTSYAYGGNGCFLEDVGWAGFYWLFGIFATIGLAVLLIKAARAAFITHRFYLFYWFLFIILSSIASAPILYNYKVVSLCFGLYLVFGYGKKIYSADNSKLQ